jgi:hypothetical protein
VDPFKPKSTKRDGPERQIQDKIKIKLKLLGWHVMETHGNMYQTGFPDLYVMHPKYGARWVEVKNPLAYSFTPAQMKEFPMMVAHGVGVWVLVSDSDDEYEKLFKPCNWHQYLSVFKVH